VVATAIAAGDGLRALTAALAWWRDTHAPAVADLVDHISRAISTDAITDQAAWSKLAASRDPGVLGSLLPAIPELPASYLPTAGQLLAAFPADPRLAIATATWAIDPPTTSSSTYPFWTKVLDALGTAGDVRAIAPLRKRLKMPRGGSQFWPKFYTGLERVLAKLEAVEPMPANTKGLDASKLPRVVRAVSAGTPKPAGDSIADAIAHLDAGRIAPAIDVMVAVWRGARGPQLATAIDRASLLLRDVDLPIVAPPKKSLEPWLALLAEHGTAAMPRLLRHLNTGGAAFAERRLLELANLPDDPRVSYRLAEVSCFYGISPERTQYWKATFELLARHRDIRTYAPLRDQFRSFEGTYYNHHRQGKRLIGGLVLADATAPVEDIRALDAAIARAEAKQPRTERELIAAIAAAPDDDAPRKVYADWLQDRGHPRGEVIALELAKADRKKHVALYATEYVFGALEDVSDRYDRQLERGLVRVLAVDANTGTLTWRALAREPMVALVEEIAFSYTTLQRPTPDDFAAAIAAMPRLTAISFANEILEDIIPVSFARDGMRFVRQR